MLFRSDRVAVAAATIALALAALTPPAARADEAYPDQPIRVVIGFSAGSSVDLAARIIGEKLGEAWKQPVVTENRPGAGGVIAAQTVGRATPDGYTLLSVSASHVILPALSSTLPYHPRDFAGITTTVSVPAVLVVSSLAWDQVRRRTGRDGEGKARRVAVFLRRGWERHALCCGAVQKPHGDRCQTRAIQRHSRSAHGGDSRPGSFYFFPLASVLPLAKTGEVLALAVAPASRVAALPSVPTLAEAGVPGYRWDTWFGLLAPAQTPRAIVTKLNQEVRRILDLPDVRKRVGGVMGAEAMPMTPEEFDRYSRSSFNRCPSSSRQPTSRSMS